VEHLPADTFWIKDHCDGANRAEKYARDEALLRMDLKDNPRDERTVFYLAQTLDNMSTLPEHAARLDEAIELYIRRVSMGGYADEVWMSRYRAGKCLLRTGRWNEAIGCLLDCWARKPDRIEPLYHIATAYRNQNYFRAAFELANFFDNVPTPAGLFVERKIYEFGAAEVIVGSAYHVAELATEKRIEHGLEASEKILRAEGSNKAAALEKASWYLPILGGTQRAIIPEQVDDIWSACNPSWAPGGLNVRLVNYEQKNGRVYSSKDKDKKIRTRNVIVGDDGTVREWSYRLKGAETDHEIRGLEDVRFYGNYFTATCCEVPGAKGNPQVVLGHLFGSLADVVTLKEVPFAREVEKNWVILSEAHGRIEILYSLNPFIVITVFEDGSVSKITRKATPLADGLWRNSTIAIERQFGDQPGYLMLAHDVGRRTDKNVYMHRWVWISKQRMIPERYSKPFAFSHHGIEYASGLRFTDTGEVEIAFGYEDRQARVVKYPASIVQLTESL
jgi:tetratricopeptide (TPR) repeat protein